MVLIGLLYETPRIPQITRNLHTWAHCWTPVDYFLPSPNNENLCMSRINYIQLVSEIMYTDTLLRTPYSSGSIHMRNSSGSIHVRNNVHFLKFLFIYKSYWINYLCYVYEFFVMRFICHKTWMEATQKKVWTPRTVGSPLLCPGYQDLKNPIMVAEGCWPV